MPFCRTGIDHVTLNQFSKLLELLRISQQQFAPLGQFKRVAHAVEQWSVERSLKVANARRNGWLGQVENLRRLSSVPHPEIRRCPPC